MRRNNGQLICHAERSNIVTISIFPLLDFLFLITRP